MHIKQYQLKKVHVYLTHLKCTIHTGGAGIYNIRLKFLPAKEVKSGRHI